MLDDLQKELTEINNQYIVNELVITKLQLQLKHHINNTFSSTDLYNAIQFCNDRVTLFRFLLETKFDYEKTYKQLIDNIQWRIEEKIDELKWEDFRDWLKDGFIFYHQYDQLGQPIAILRLRYFPLEIYQKDKIQFGEKLKSFACFMMEIARKWTLNETLKKENERMNNDEFYSFLTLRLNVIVDMKATLFLPMDKSTLESLSHTMEFRYPHFVGKIHILNFGWIHNALWHIVKFILSDETKNKINFTNHQHLLQIITKENLLKEFGGSNDYEWVMETNEIIQKYGIHISDVLSPKLKSVLSLSYHHHEGYYTNDHQSDFDLNNNNEKDDDKDSMQTSYGSTSFRNRNTYPNVLHYFGLSSHQIGLHAGSGFLTTPYNNSRSTSCLTTPLITPKKIINNDIDVDDVDDDEMILDYDHFHLNSYIHSNETITDGSTLFGHSSILTDDETNNVKYNNTNNNNNNNNIINSTIFMSDDFITKKQHQQSILSPPPTPSSILINSVNHHDHLTLVNQSTQTNPIIIQNGHRPTHKQLSFNDKFWLIFKKSVFYMVMYIILRIPIESFFYMQLTSYIDQHQQLLISTIGITALFVFFLTPILLLPNNIVL